MNSMPKSMNATSTCERDFLTSVLISSKLVFHYSFTEGSNTTKNTASE